MKLRALANVNRRLYPALADNKQGIVPYGDAIEVTATQHENDGFLWRNILNTPLWVAQGTYKDGEFTSLFFEIIESEPPPIPEPEPIPEPPPIEFPCSLELDFVPKELETGHIISENARMVRVGDKFWFDVIFIVKGEQVSIYVLAVGEGVTDVKIVATEEL